MSRPWRFNSIPGSDDSGFESGLISCFPYCDRVGMVGFLKFTNFILLARTHSRPKSWSKVRLSGNLNLKCSALISKWCRVTSCCTQMDSSTPRQVYLAPWLCSRHCLTDYSISTVCLKWMNQWLRLKYQQRLGCSVKKVRSDTGQPIVSFISSVVWKTAEFERWSTSRPVQF